MPQTNPFTVTIYDKNLAPQQRLGSALVYDFTPRWTLGTGKLVTSVADPANALLAAEGARIVVEYRREVLMSGWVYQDTGPVQRAGTVQWDVYDDKYPALAWVRAWVRPGQNLTPSSLTDTAQMVPPAGGHADGRADGAGYYAWPATPTVYPAETAIKRVISDNLARFGSGVVQGKIDVQTDQGRGGDARAAGMLPQLRFDALSDGLADLQAWSGLGIRVWQPVGATRLKLDVWQPVTWPQVLRAASGIVTDGQYQRSGPTATRPILGGPGDDAARLFWAGPAATDLETRFGVAIETFTDATGSTLKWPDGLDDAAQVAMYFLQRTDVAAADKTALSTYLAQAAATALADGRPTRGLNVTLSETKTFHYGGDGTDGTPPGYHVGDLVTIGADGGPTITERITECTLTYSTGSGAFSVVPKVGEIQQDPTAQIAEVVGALATALSRMQSRT